MHNLMWLVRAARWVRNPPSAKMVMMVFGIIAVALVIAGVEWLGYWSEWATMERQPRIPR